MGVGALTIENLAACHMAHDLEEEMAWEQGRRSLWRRLYIDSMHLGSSVWRASPVIR